jgi:hypothetical protein
MIMTEHLDPIPDDLPTCQERLRAVLERLPWNVNSTSSATEEMQRSYVSQGRIPRTEADALRRAVSVPEAPGSNTSSMTSAAAPA